MIVDFEGLTGLRGGVTLVDGSFDPIHEGHIAYFAAARALGHPVLCNVCPDDWTIRKHPILLTQAQRGVVLDAIRHLDYVHLSAVSTRDVLDQLRPSVYAKGKDWEARGGVPEAERAICAAHGIRVVYLDTVLNSSTAILGRRS